MYQFRLHRVLEYRQMLEERVEREFHAVQKILQQEKALLERLQKEYQESLEKWTALPLTRKILGAELKLRYRYQLLLAQKIEAQKAVVAKQAEMVNAKQQDLLKARQEKKAIEKLQEKDKQRYLKEQAKQEQLFFDEFALKGGHHET